MHHRCIPNTKAGGMIMHDFSWLLRCLFAQDKPSTECILDGVCNPRMLCDEFSKNIHVGSGDEM